MRRRIAQYLVRSVAECMDKSYDWFVRGDKGEEPREYAEYFSQAWARNFRERQWMVRLAQRIHKDAALDSMIESGWWY